MSHPFIPGLARECSWADNDRRLRSCSPQGLVQAPSSEGPGKSQQETSSSSTGFSFDNMSYPVSDTEELPHPLQKA